jgi:hypothetical protein
MQLPRWADADPGEDRAGEQRQRSSDHEGGRLGNGGESETTPPRSRPGCELRAELSPGCGLRSYRVSAEAMPRAAGRSTRARRRRGARFFAPDRARPEVFGALLEVSAQRRGAAPARAQPNRHLGAPGPRGRVN